MTIEQIEQIEQIRLVQSKGNAAALMFISKNIGGPTTEACFCSSTTWKAFYKAFYSWYDNKILENNNTND